MGITTLITLSYCALLIAFCFCVERKIWDMAIVIALLMVLLVYILV